MRARRIKFLNPNSAPPLPPGKADGFRDVWRGIQPLVITFLLVTVGCAVLYFVGSFYGCGIRATFADASSVGFFDCLHFSIVTIATLGYGDYRPESVGRLVAGLEVLAGMVLMGLFIARLVSRRQDRFTSRLVSGQLNSEIQDFRDVLAGLLKAFKADAPIDTTLRSTVLFNASGLSSSIARYWRYQAAEPDLADVIQLRAAGRLLGGLITLVECVSDCVAGQTSDSIDPQNRKYVRKITESALVVATVLYERVDDSGISHSYQRVAELVSNLRTQLQLSKV
jgi:Ion channel